MTKAEIEKKKSLARTLYLSGMEQQEIADKVEVSRVTISKWSTAEGWKEARAAKNITRPELVNKLLLTIDTLITQVNSSNNPQLIAGLSDKLAKLSEVIEKLDKKANMKVRFGVSGVISTKDSKIPVVVIPTNEELMIARETVAVLSK